MMTGIGMVGFGGFIFMALFWIVIIAAGIWLLSNLFPKNNGSSQNRDAENASALEILKQRYARGELTKEEYESMRYDLEN